MPSDETFPTVLGETPVHGIRFGGKIQAVRFTTELEAQIHLVGLRYYRKHGVLPKDPVDYAVKHLAQRGLERDTPIRVRAP